MPFVTANSIAQAVVDDLETLGLADTVYTWAPAKDVCGVELEDPDPDRQTLEALHTLLSGTWDGDHGGDGESWRIPAPHPGRRSPRPSDRPCEDCGTTDRPRFRVAAGPTLCVIHHTVRTGKEVPT